MRKGRAGEGGQIVALEKNDESHFITLPAEMLDRLGWEVHDVIEIQDTENCFDWGEVTSLVVRNLTQELV